MTAEIVAVGTELLLGDIADTNSQVLGKLLARYGFDHYRRSTVGDNVGRCADVIRESLQRADVVFTIGGLGPTQDDVTRQAIALAIDEEVVQDEDALHSLRQFLAERKRDWNDAFGRQAMRPKNAVCLTNRLGTAPGIHWQGDGKHVIALPGPRQEFCDMLDVHVEPFLNAHSNMATSSVTLRIVGVPESVVEQIVGDLMQSENPTVAPYAKLGEVHLRITANGNSKKDSQKLIEPVAALVKAKLGTSVYGEGDEDLPNVVLKLLGARRATLATAESCTGGMLGERITSVAGSSSAYLGGFVTYSNEMKSRELGVARVDLERYGAVSETVAAQMAEGAKRVTGSDYGTAITGVAGPDGGTTDKPVGLVYVSVCGPSGTEVTENRYLGNREAIRYRSTQTALAMLREHLLR